MKQIKLGMVNCYYLQNDEGNILIDTGYAHDKDLFLARLAKEEIAINDIAYILLSHHHDDHCGLVTYLLDHNPKIQLIMHPLCSILTAKGSNATEYGGLWCSRRMKILMALYEKLNLKRISTYPPFSGREHDLLLDFSHGPVLFHGYTILPTPGHTPDSISLLDSKGNLFCGDASANFLHFAGTKYAPPIITDLQEFYETWKKLLDLPIQQIYPGHGKSFTPDKLEHKIHALKAKKPGPIRHCYPMP